MLPGGRGGVVVVVVASCAKGGCVCAVSLDAVVGADVSLERASWILLT